MVPLENLEVRIVLTYGKCDEAGPVVTVHTRESNMLNNIIGFCVLTIQTNQTFRIHLL